MGMILEMVIAMMRKMLRVMMIMKSAQTPDQTRPHGSCGNFWTLQGTVTLLGNNTLTMLTTLTQTWTIGHIWPHRICPRKNNGPKNLILIWSRSSSTMSSLKDPCYKSIEFTVTLNRRVELCKHLRVVCCERQLSFVGWVKIIHFGGVTCWK